MTNNIINTNHSRFANRIAPISNGEQNFSKKNQQNYTSNHQKLISISPVLMGYKVGSRYIGKVEKKLSNKKYLLSVNNETFYITSNLNFEINTKISIEIDSIVRNYILANLIAINDKIVITSEKAELEFVEKIDLLKKKEPSEFYFDEKSTNFIELLNLISFHENDIFKKYILNKLPSYDSNDSKKIFDLISNISNSNLQNWLSITAFELLKKNKKIDITSEIEKINKIEKSNSWLSLLIPYFNNEKTRVFDFHLRLTEEKTKRIRFRVIFELEKTGKTIIEGIVGLNKVNMIIFFSNKYDEFLEKKIKTIFYNSLNKYNYLGTIKFNKIAKKPSKINVYKNNHKESNYKIDI